MFVFNNDTWLLLTDSPKFDKGERKKKKIAKCYLCIESESTARSDRLLLVGDSGRGKGGGTHTSRGLARAAPAERPARRRAGRHTAALFYWGIWNMTEFMVKIWNEIDVDVTLFPTLFIKTLYRRIFLQMTVRFWRKFKSE